MTCPNDNENQDSDYIVNIELLGENSDLRTLVLDEMRGRSPLTTNEHNMNSSNPLVSIMEEITLQFIKSSECETNEDLKQGYANNISLVLFIKVGDKTVLLSGDLLKEGMKYLIDNDSDFNNSLSDNGVDYLIAPHHGLQTVICHNL